MSYTYDANGNVLTVTDGSGVITREFDALNRVAQYTDSRGNVIKYAYDAVGNLTTLTYPGGKQVKYEYDAANRLTRVTDWAGRATVYEYDANSRLVKTTRPDGTVLTGAFDAAGQLVQQKDVDPGGSVILKYDYTYDAAGNITAEESGAEAPLAVDNTDMTYTADNRLATYKGQSVQYDADGNMTLGPLGGGMAVFAYDSLSRLTGVDGTGYLYDAEDSRISVTDSVYQTSTSYVVNPHAPLSQVLIKSDGQGQTYYVYGLGLIGQQEPDGTYKTYHYDYQGSTVALTDKNGGITDRFQYGPYGEVTRRMGETDTPFLYCGNYGVMHDGNGLYYMRARYYSSEVGRFVNQDRLTGSVEQTQSLNRFAYVEGGPVSRIDPMGLWGENVHKDATILVARDLGFSDYFEKGQSDVDYSDIIGKADNAVDWTWSTAPYHINNEAQSWHFDRNPEPNIDSRRVHSEDCLQNAIQLWKNASLAYKEIMQKDGGQWFYLAYRQRERIRNQALTELGKGLHPLQDIDAHMSWGTDDFENPLGYSRRHLDANRSSETFDDPRYDFGGNYIPVDSGNEYGSSRYRRSIEETYNYLRRFINETQCE